MRKETANFMQVKGEAQAQVQVKRTNILYLT